MTLSSPAEGRSSFRHASILARRNDFGGGAAMEGGPGVLPGEKISKIKANCKHFRAFGAISVYGNYNERLFDSAKTKKMLRSGTNITLPREKIQKLEPIASIPKHLVPFQCTWTFDSATNHDRGQGFATFALRSSRFVAVC